jgi:hypothetical protein
MLRLSLEPDAKAREPGLLRQGRAIGWIQEALAPLRAPMSEAELRQLTLAIRSDRDRVPGGAHRRRRALPSLSGQAHALKGRCRRSSAIVFSDRYGEPLFPPGTTTST